MENNIPQLPVAESTAVESTAVESTASATTSATNDTMTESTVTEAPAPIAVFIPTPEDAVHIGSNRVAPQLRDAVENLIAFAELEADIPIFCSSQPKRLVRFECNQAEEAEAVAANLRIGRKALEFLEEEFAVTVEHELGWSRCEVERFERVISQAPISNTAVSNTTASDAPAVDTTAPESTTVPFDLSAFNYDPTTDDTVQYWGSVFEPLPEDAAILEAAEGACAEISSPVRKALNTLLTFVNSDDGTVLIHGVSPCRISRFELSGPADFLATAAALRTIKRAADFLLEELAATIEHRQAEARFEFEQYAAMTERFDLQALPRAQFEEAQNAVKTVIEC